MTHEPRHHERYDAEKETPALARPLQYEDGDSNPDGQKLVYPSAQDDLVLRPARGVRRPDRPDVFHDLEGERSELEHALSARIDTIAVLDCSARHARLVHGRGHRSLEKAASAWNEYK